jgi:hypothetical protein
MKLEFCRQIFEKYSDMKFHENPSSESRVVPRRQTDGHDNVNSRFFAFFFSRKRPKMVFIEKEPDISLLTFTRISILSPLLYFILQAWSVIACTVGHNTKNLCIV